MRSGSTTRRDQGRRRVGRDRWRALASAPLIGLLLVGVAASGAGAESSTDRSAVTAARRGQATDAGLINVSAVSPYVPPTGTFQVSFAPATGVPADSTLTYTIHSPLRPTGNKSLRDVVDEVIDGGSTGPILRAPVSAPVSTYGDPTAGLTVSVAVRDERGDSTSAFLPSAGIHPVELALTSAAGAELWAATVFLNHLPANLPTTGANQVQVSLLVDVDSQPAIGPDGAARFSIEDRAAITSAESLVTDVANAPWTLAIRPNTLDALARSPNVADRRFMETVASTGYVGTVAREPYVDIDTAGLIDVGASNEAQRQLAVGEAVVTERLGRTSSRTDWYDDTITTNSLAFVRTHGATRVVLPADRLRLPDGVNPDAAWTTTIGVQGGGGLTATAYDAAITNRLTATDVAPGLRAHTAVTDLMASWFTAAEDPTERFPGPTSVIVVPGGTDPAAVQALLPALTTDGPLTSDPAAIPTQPAKLKGRPVIADLTDRVPDDMSSAVALVRETRTRIGGWRSMVGEADPEIPLWETLVDQSLSTERSPGERAVDHRLIRAEISERVDSIVLPEPRRVVVTSDDQTIPLRFRNGTPFPVHLIMRTRSPRLEFDKGETQEIVLEPGQNLIDLAVSIRAPGESLLRIDVASPDASIQLGSTSVPVNSSRISGVGAVLSIISIAVLIIWWIRTHRRRKRADTRSSGRHPAVDPAESVDNTAESAANTGESAADTAESAGDGGPIDGPSTDRVDDGAEPPAVVSPEASPADTVDFSG